jgi:hypothetical protein
VGRKTNILPPPPSFSARTMALTLLRLFETKTPLLPVVVVASRTIVALPGGGGGPRAIAETMPASTEDYVWTYTESGEESLRPVVVAVVGCDSNVKRRL